MHILVYRSTFVLLGMAWAIALLWFFSKPDFEPALTAAALLASITGIFAERWFVKQELREQHFGMVIQEIQVNLLVVNSRPFAGDIELGEKLEEKVFLPRLLSDAMDAFIASGEFSSLSDRPFLYALYRHRQVIEQANRKMNAIELKLFIAGASGQVRSSYLEALRADDGPIGEVRTDLLKIEECLKRSHPKEYAKGLTSRFGPEVLEVHPHQGS